MSTVLNADDPLAGQEVMITLTLPASDQPREARLALLSVGVAQRLPVMQSGRLEELPALITQAWTALGLRLAQEPAAQPAASAPPDEAVETVLAEEVVEADPAPPTPAPTAVPKPQAGNLSLF